MVIWVCEAMLADDKRMVQEYKCCNYSEIVIGVDIVFCVGTAKTVASIASMGGPLEPVSVSWCFSFLTIGGHDTSS